tara:strand:+ start:4356 stop:4514 length:159 start_codon:yes stop_codon:yes gene_type:complete
LENNNPTLEIKVVVLSTLIMKGYLDIQVNIENATNLKATQPAAKTVLLKNVN